MKCNDPPSVVCCFILSGPVNCWRASVSSIKFEGKKNNSNATLAAA